MGVFSLDPVQKALVAVYSGVASDVFGLTLVIPVITPFSLKLGADPEFIGILFSVFTGGSFLMSLFVGKIADTFGRRAVFLYCSFGAFAAFLFSSLCQTFTQLVISRAIAGIFSGTISTSFAYVSDIVPAESRPKYLSYVSATMSMCFVIGPLIGGGLAAFGLRIPFYTAAVIAFLCFLNALFFIKEPSEVKREVEKQTAKRRSSYIAISDAHQEDNSIQMVSAEDTHEKDSDKVGDKSTKALTDDSQKQISPWKNWKAVCIGGFGTFFNSCSYTALAVLPALFLQKSRFGIVSEGSDGQLTEEEGEELSLTLGYYLGLFGLIQVISTIFVFPRVMKICGLVLTAAIGALLHGLGIIAMYYTRNLNELVPVYILLSTANSFIRPAMPAYLGSLAPPGMTARYISLNSTFMTMAMMMAGQLTVLYEKSPAQAFYVAASFSFFNAIMLAGMGLYLMGEEAALKKKESEKEVDNSTISSRMTALKLFFGEGVPEDEYWDGVVTDLKQICLKNNLHIAVKTKKGQKLVREFLLTSLPALPDDFEDRMATVKNLYAEFGWTDFSDNLGLILAKTEDQHAHLEFGVPGRA